MFISFIAVAIHSFGYCLEVISHQVQVDLQAKVSLATVAYFVAAHDLP